MNVIAGGLRLLSSFS